MKEGDGDVHGGVVCATQAMSAGREKTDWFAQDWNSNDSSGSENTADPTTSKNNDGRYSSRMYLPYIKSWGSCDK